MKILLHSLKDFSCQIIKNNIFAKDLIKHEEKIKNFSINKVDKEQMLVI
jgi:hypothetical protein